MNRTNARLNAFAVEQLKLSRSDRVLEIGFGGGVVLPALLSSAAFVAGVDRSSDVVDDAKKRFLREVRAGRADFFRGSVESLPFPTGSYDKICTVNTVYFWSSLDAGAREIHRVLKPGGRAVLGFLPKENMDRMGVPADIFTTRTIEDVLAALRAAGFFKVELVRPESGASWAVAVADTAS